MLYKKGLHTKLEKNSIVESGGTDFFISGKELHIEEGANLVFSYEYMAEDDASIEDDEYAEFIRFEIDPQLSEFNFKDDELLDINAVFSVSCFCSFSDDPEKDVPPKGIIRGEKISATQWSVSIDVIFYGHKHRKITHIFQLKN